MEKNLLRYIRSFEFVAKMNLDGGIKISLNAATVAVNKLENDIGNKFDEEVDRTIAEQFLELLQPHILDFTDELIAKRGYVHSLPEPVVDFSKCKVKFA